MSIPGPPDLRSKEEKTADYQRWIDKHYLEEERSYSIEVFRLWDTTSHYGRRIYSWHVYIRQAEKPWNGVVATGGFKTKWGAEKWARDYIKRGGPPEGYFDPKSQSNVFKYTKC